TERLSRMVRTLLDMSELKTVPRTDRIQLAPMIEEVLADLSPLAEKSGVTLSQSGEDLWITGSDVLVYRAIFNLVENGVKYNRPGGSVCAAVSRRGEEAMIEIKDTGCGIREDFRRACLALLPGG
ncbi:MAG: sensor histidine kinase, partial [Christensenellales bacterium]